MESQEGTRRAAESISHRYDVFINHRGPDVKNIFVRHLYAALKRAGFRPFLDEEDIELGRDVYIAICEALKGSWVHVAIFSVGYAESKCCLNELCMMLESGKDILPVFYHVDPADLRMTNNGPFQEGFRIHSERATEEQISKWKESLRKLSFRRGLRLDEVKWNEEELVRRIVVEVQRLMPIVSPGAVEQVKPPEVEAPEVGALERVVPPEAAEAPEANAIGQVEPEPAATFNLGNRRRNILVLGDPKSVEAVVSHICGARRQHTQVKNHVNLRERRISSQSMFLYSHTKPTKEINKNYLRDIRTFVKARNKKWLPTEVEALWVQEVHRAGPRNRRALFPDSTLRLHMVWFVCRKLKGLPDTLEWPKFTEILCDLPIQILVIDKQRTQSLDMNDQQDFNKILEHGSDFFPKARKFMEDLIVKAALQDDDLREELWRKCWSVKTRVEIGNAAKIIWEIRRQLGSAGISDQRGVGGARLRRKASLSRSGEFVLNFLCTYWDIPQDSLSRVLQGTTNFISQARGGNYKISIKPGEFVEFCLKVAAIILSNTQDNARKPNVSSESSLDQLLQTEARECYRSHFASSTSLNYDKMRFESIRLFLERLIFDREGWHPHPVGSVHRDSLASKIMKRIGPH